jgi:transposase-like protein
MGQNTQQIVKRYSVAFKKQVVKEYEAGASASALKRKYGLGCTHMVVKWVKKYGREGVRHKLMVVQTPKEQEQLKELEARVAELEKLVAQLSLDKFMLESWGMRLKKSRLRHCRQREKAIPRRAKQVEDESGLWMGRRDPAGSLPASAAASEAAS